MNPVWFLRMARWARNPPGWRKVLLVLGIIAACLVIYAIERWVGWPDWMTADRMRPRP